MIANSTHNELLMTIYIEMGPMRLNGEILGRFQELIYDERFVIKFLRAPTFPYTASFTYN